MNEKESILNWPSHLLSGRLREGEVRCRSKKKLNGIFEGPFFFLRQG